jgi:hypothetical protein
VAEDVFSDLAVAMLRQLVYEITESLPSNVKDLKLLMRSFD